MFDEPPEELRRYLGDDAYEVEDGGSLSWDYGFVEFFWSSQGSRFEVNLYRVAWSLSVDDLSAKVSLVRGEDGTFVHPESGPWSGFTARASGRSCARSAAAGAWSFPATACPK